MRIFTEKQKIYMNYEHLKIETLLTIKFIFYLTKIGSSEENIDNFITRKFSK